MSIGNLVFRLYSRGTDLDKEACEELERADLKLSSLKSTIARMCAGMSTYATATGMRRFSSYGDELKSTDPDMHWYWCRKEEVEVVINRLNNELHGYQEAYFKIADELGSMAMPISPEEALEKVILPKIRALKKTFSEHLNVPCVNCGVKRSLHNAGGVGACGIWAEPFAHSAGQNDGS